MNALFALKQDASLEKILENKKLEINIEIAQDKYVFMNKMKSQFDIVVANCNLFGDVYPWEWMLTIKEKSPAAKVIILLDHEVYDASLQEVVTRLSNDFGYLIVPSGQSPEEIGTAVSNELFKPYVRNTTSTDLGEVISVWSTSNKDGASTIAGNTALAIAQKFPELRVGLIDLNLKNPEIWTNFNLTDRGRNNLKIRPKMQTGTLSSDDLLAACLVYGRLKNLHILTGSSRRDTAFDVTPEMIHHLLNTAKATFDITIVDAGAQPDNAGTISAVRLADHKWLVTQNYFSSFKLSWGEWFDCVWKYCGIEPKDIALIVNRSTKSGEGKSISNHLGMQLLAEVPNIMGGEGLRAVNEGIPAYQLGVSEEFNEKINELVRSAAGKHVSSNDNPEKKQGIFKKLSSLF